MDTVQPGEYEHFKGGRYRVLHTAIHSETGEELVVYEALKDGGIWVRPKEMFCEEVERDGKRVPRFRYLHG